MSKISIIPKISYCDLPNLKNKNVLVVGGTHGIGEALVVRCLELGANVTTIGLSKNNKLNCKQIIHDVVNNPKPIEKYFVGTDFVFNNIGLYEKARIVDTTPARLKKVLRYNLETMFLLIKYSILHTSMVVVNMSSRPTLESYDSWSLYTLSKQAIITITQAAAEEGKQKHYAICPSRVNTKFRESVFPNEDLKTRLTPEQTAEIILWLFNGKNPSGSHYWVKKIY